MKVVGIIAEYNPFHNGHFYQLKTSIEKSGADFSIIVMSGNFMQRGTPAITDKFNRAHMALLCGADLVLELPVVYSTASAEYFAAGAVALLDKLGVTDFLYFGSEIGDIKPLQMVSKILFEESDRFQTYIRNQIKTGETYPAARKKAVEHELKYSGLSPDTNKLCLEVLDSPNNILGIEYSKALLRRKSGIIPGTIERIGTGYHENKSESQFNSASGIRKIIFDCSDFSKISHSVPPKVYAFIKDTWAKTFPIHENDFSSLLKYRLLTEKNSLTDYFDVSNNLSNRITKNTYLCNQYTDFADHIKSKETTRTRINRCLLHILLQIRSEDVKEFIDCDYIAYARILGFQKNSTPLLSQIKAHSSIPLVTKPSDAKKFLPDWGRKMLEYDILASDIYHTIVSDKFKQPLYSEYRTGFLRT